MSFDVFSRQPSPGTFRVLAICTGNVCRSPLAERILKSSLAGLPVSVESAGTRALVGKPMTPQTIETAERFGLEISEPHVSRQLTEEMLDEADLVLGLSRAHRRDAVGLLPKVSRYVYTLREFSRLADALASEIGPSRIAEDSGARIREVVGYISQMRGAVPPPVSADLDDVVDPYRENDDVYERSAGQIIPATDSIANLLRFAVESGRRDST